MTMAYWLASVHGGVGGPGGVGGEHGGSGGPGEGPQLTINQSTVYIAHDNAASKLFQSL